MGNRATNHPVYLRLNLRKSVQSANQLLPFGSMSYTRFGPNRTPCGNTRRQFLWEVGGGFAGLALADLLARDGFLTSPAGAAEGDRDAHPLAPQRPHFTAQAKHCIFLFMNGAPSQVDTFDPKPALTKHHGQPYSGSLKVGSNGRPVGYLTQSP